MLLTARWYSVIVGTLGIWLASTALLSADEIEITLTKLLNEQAAAWNRGDLDRFMDDYWRSDALTFSSGGKIQRGWQATLDNYRRRYPTRALMGHVSFDSLEFTPLGDSACLVLGDWRLTRDSGPIGGKFTLIFRRIDDRWLIVHDHTSVDPALASTSNEVRPIACTMVDNEAIHYATFQSHNQKVVSDGKTIYMAHLRTRNADYTAQQWRLSFSRDRGETFQAMCEETLGTNPPVLEIDSQGNLYLVRVDFPSGHAYLDRWSSSAPRDISGRTTTQIPNAAAGKYAAMLDEGRNRFYFFSHNNSFHRLTLDGQLLDSRQLLTAGPHAMLQYPLLTLDDKGRLFTAWTTQKHGEYLYWDIHLMQSDDGGTKFQTLQSQPLTIPVVADDTGPADRVTRDDEFVCHTWLSSCLARNGYWHGIYLAQSNPPRQHYVRYDLASGRQDIDQQPEWRGETIALQGLDGFLVADRHDPHTLYGVGNDHGFLACLVSHDDGQTWHDFAKSSQSYALYSIGGYRWTTSDDLIVGSFTDQSPPVEITDQKSRVYGFRISTERRP